MNHPLLTKGYRVTAAIQPGRMVVSTPGKELEISQASSPVKPIKGVIAHDDDAIIGRIADVHLAGMVPVWYGGNVAAEDSLTTDATGNAVKAAPTAGQLVYCLGFAEISGLAGERGVIRIDPHVLKG